MRKFILFFIIFTGFKTASAQLEFYQFMFNIFDSEERLTDSRRFGVSVNIYDRERPGEIKYYKYIFPGDTSKNLGYDYNYFNSGDLLFERTAEIIIAEGADTMKIVFDNPKASAWTSIGIDKLSFKKGTFKFTQENWPKDLRERPQNNRNFNYIREDFDWEKIRQ